MYFNGYDPYTAGILDGVFRRVWSALQSSESDFVASVIAAQATKIKITRALLDAADNGERDPVRLKLLALEAVSAGTSPSTKGPRIADGASGAEVLRRHGHGGLGRLVPAGDSHTARR